MARKREVDLPEGEVRERLRLFINSRWEEKLGWLIRLRWAAVGGLLAALAVSRYILAADLPYTALAMGAGALLVSNVLFLLYNRQLHILIVSHGLYFKKANRFANVQISTDWLILTFLIHFSGGIENPFLYFYMFHMISASVLLSRRIAYLQASLATVLLGAIVLGERTGILEHYHLIGAATGESCRMSTAYVVGLFIGFIVTTSVIVYIAVMVVGRLRQGEREAVVASFKLEEQDRLKSRYVQTVSHDLQASLAAIQGCLKVVLDGTVGTIPDKAEEMIGRAERRSQQVLHFVKDLLDLSRIRADRDSARSRVCLGAELTRIAEQLQPKAHDKEVKLSVKNPFDHSWVNADPGALEQVLVNLIVNAIRYTPSGGEVGVEVTEEPSGWHTVVWDTGIGIHEDDMAHLFDDFYRAANAEEMDKNGTGLGLSIVKEIVGNHGGRIWVESRVNKGSRFNIILPKAVEALAAGRQA